jgi:TRAP-type C4-dicarboxylate transport system permease small subunit
MKSIDKYIWKSVDILILIAVLGMVALITLQVGSRIARQSVPWTEELSRLLFIWTIWLGLAGSFRAGTHTAITFVPEMAPEALRPLIRIIPAVASVLLLGAVSWFGFALVQQQMRFGEQSAILRIGMWWSTVPLVLGSALGVVGVIVDAVTRDPLAELPLQKLPAAEGPKP